MLQVLYRINYHCFESFRPVGGGAADSNREIEVPLSELTYRIVVEE
jgi:hypothetical protein